MPSSLISFLQGNPNCLRAHLFSIALPTGQTLNVTDGQFDITVPAGTPGWLGETTVFYATQYGRWERGPITSAASFSFASNSMQLTCTPQQGTSYPGLSIGMLAAALNNLFDAAQVRVYCTYMPNGQYGNVSNGVMTKFFGTITEIIDINRVMVTFGCADPLYLCNMKVPSRLIQVDCPWSFADGNCNPPGGASAYTVTFTAASGVTQSNLSATSALSQPDGYFTQGVVTCLTGANAGLSQMVKEYLLSHLILQHPFLLPVAPGDTFSVIKGCDHTVATCIATTQANGTAADNVTNFGGMPFTPVPTEAV